MAAVIDTPNGIQWFHMRAQLGALRLEALGMRHSSGRSVCAHIKRTYGLKGNKQAVLAQFEKLVEAARNAE